MRRDYFSRLSRAARWFLPPAEAAEVLEDYREIVVGRSEEELRRDLGTPRAAMRQLAQPKAYRRWLAAFAGLTVCLLLPSGDVVLSELNDILFTAFGLWFFNGITRPPWYAEPLLPLGIVLALVWFQRNGRKETVLSKWIVPLLLLLLLGIAGMSFLAWMILTERWDLLNSVLNFLCFGNPWMVRLPLGLDALAAGIIGMAGLIKARLTDRRWRAVYVLGLTGAAACAFMWKMFSCMTWEYGPGWQTPLVMRYAFIILMGFIGTGVSLC